MWLWFSEEQNDKGKEAKNKTKKKKNTLTEKEGSWNMLQPSEI